jgi:putative DNA primase/helicase
MDYNLDDLKRIVDVDYSMDDIGNAERFTDKHGRDLHYIQSSSGRREDEGWTVWTGVWTGTHWEQDLTGKVMLRAMETARDIKAALERIEDGDRRKEARSHIKYSNSSMGIRNMLQLAAAMGSIPARPSDFDNDPWLLNCASGTIDLRTGECQPHQREDLITRVLPIGYDPDAQCPRWERFIDAITCGDKALAEYLQRAVGYSLTGITRDHALFYLYGSGGNGKGTFLGVLHALLGGYATTAAVGMLAMRSGDRNTTDIADLVGCRLVTSHEAAKDRRLDEELIKTMTGGDRIRCRHLYVNNFEFTPQFKLWFDANHHPPLHDNSEGMWRRVKVIPFRAHFQEGHADPTLCADPNLREKLLTELPGILAWAVRGSLEWQEHGLGTPEPVASATADYREAMDVIGRFLSSSCVLDPTKKVKAGQLYAAYQKWCNGAGESQMTETQFGRDLTDRGYHVSRAKDGRYRCGLGLR